MKVRKYFIPRMVLTDLGRLKAISALIQPSALTKIKKNGPRLRLNFASLGRAYLNVRHGLGAFPPMFRGRVSAYTVGSGGAGARFSLVAFDGADELF